MASLIETKKYLESLWLKPRSAITGIGIDYNTNSIIIYKNTSSDLNLPAKVNEYPIKVFGLHTISPSIPIFSPHQFTGGQDPCAALHGPNTNSQARYRPLCGGISAAHYLVQAGTLGLILKDMYTRKPVLLSNNHVFANMSSITDMRARKGDAVIQPSLADGGNIENDTVAKLERWIPYDTIGNNLVDAAIAKPLPGMVPEIPDLILSHGSGDEFTYPENMISVSSSIHVRKYGRTGGVTTGKVMDWDFSTVVPYPTGIQVKYVDQLFIKIDTCAGDSGAVYLDDNDNLIGLHAGGALINGERYAIANKIKNVTALLGLALH